jgi:hypothetical protein
MTLGPHSRGAGLFSHINHVLTNLEHAGHRDVFVDWSHGLPYAQEDGSNIFEALFYQNTPQPNGPAQSFWPHYRYTGAAADTLYLGDSTWRWELNRLWGMLRVREELLAEVDTYCSAWKELPSALHVRNLHIGTECPENRPPALEEYLAAIQDRPGPVYLATDNDEAARFFADRLGERLLSRQIPRSPDMQTEYHLTARQTARDTQNCLIDALIMARCAHLVHSVSNIATAVLYMAPGMSHTYLRAGKALHFGPASENSRLVSAVKLMEPTALLHIRHPNWSDWLFCYPNAVVRRQSCEDYGVMRKLPDHQIAIVWQNWPEEIFEPRVLQADPRLHWEHFPYFRFKVKGKEF